MINLLKKHFATLPHVTWTLFSEPIEVSRSQLAAMRNLKTGSGLKKNCLADNFRFIAVPPDYVYFLDDIEKLCQREMDNE